MATSVLLKANIKFNPYSSRQQPIQFSPIKLSAKSISFCPRLILNPSLVVKCSVASRNLIKPVLELTKREVPSNPYEIVVNDDLSRSKECPEISVTKMGSFTNPYEIVGKALLEAVKSLKEPMIATVLFLVVVLFYAPNSSLAASGGRMGGSRFSSRSSSRSSPSRSSSSRSSSSRSYSSRSSGSRSYSSSSSPSFSSSSSSSHSLGSSTSSSPSLSSSSSSAPSLSSSKGPSSSYSSSSSLGGGGSSSDRLTLMGVLVRVLIVIFLIIAVLMIFYEIFKGSIGTSVLKLQVGLMGSARSLQKELNRIAETADTSKEEGLIYILKETTVAILRHPDYCISGYSYVYLRTDIEECEEKFNKISVEERGKFDEETLVNVNNTKRKSKSTKESTGLNNEYIVVTILVAANGTHELPAIISRENLKKALDKLGSFTKDKILAVEVLWTPQVEDDTLTEKELLENYPLLKPL